MSIVLRPDLHIFYKYTRKNHLRCPMMEDLNLPME